MRNTSLTGEISRAQIIAALALQGKTILVPLSDHQRYDLVVEEEGRFLRIQCKTGRLRNGVVAFYPCSIDSRSKRGGCVRRAYRGEVDVFGVYRVETRACYLVPVAEACVTECNLRVDPPKNGQKTGIRWADDYLIRADERRLS